jgi:hypothetical protein
LVKSGSLGMAGVVVVTDVERAGQNGFNGILITNKSKVSGSRFIGIIRCGF